MKPSKVHNGRDYAIIYTSVAVLKNNTEPRYYNGKNNWSKKTEIDQWNEQI